MKTNINYQNNNEDKNAKGPGYPLHGLSLPEAITWFLLTAITLYITGTVNG